MKRLLGTVGFPIKDWGLLENSPLNQFWECLLIWVCMKSATTNKQTDKQTFQRDLDHTPLLDKIMAMWKSRTYELQLL